MNHGSFYPKKNRMQTSMCCGRIVAFVMGDYESRALEIHSLVVYKTRLLGVPFSIELKQIICFNSLTWCLTRKTSFWLGLVCWVQWRNLVETIGFYNFY